MKRERTKEFSDIQLGTGNVFADLGFKNADLHLAKAALVLHMMALIGERKLTPRQAAKMMRMDQRRLCRMWSGDFSHITMDRMFEFLLAFGQDVDVVVTSKKKKDRTHRIRVFVK